MGENDLALQTINNIIKKFHDTSDISLYYITAGEMLSSIGKYEEAGKFFFETIQLGLPKFFTKSDLMFILSRSFEQLGFDVRMNNTDSTDEGYQMVYQHMISESNEYHSHSQSQIIKDNFDDWIHDFYTWCHVADKCSMLGLYGLAADLYGQGLVRNYKAFSKPSQWIRFAKACFRCGRMSDAQLAMKVTLNIILLLLLLLLLVLYII
jgi:hypothetical protein